MDNLLLILIVIIAGAYNIRWFDKLLKTQQDAAVAGVRYALLRQHFESNQKVRSMTNKPRPKQQSVNVH